MTPLELVWYVLQDGFWAAIPAVGFAMVFNVPVRTLFACALGGAIGHGLRALMLQLGFGMESATLAAATVVGFLGVVFARRWHAPAQVFTVAAVIPMIPGKFAYSTMMGALEMATTSEVTQQLLLETAVNALKTFIILGALAIGIAAPSLLFLRRKPVV